MKRKTLIGIMSVLALVAVMGGLAVSGVFAQTNTPQAQATPGTKPLGGGLGMGFGFFGGSTAEFDAQAKALNLTPTQLFEQLHSGKTLSEIATAQGVDLAKVQAAAQAVEVQATKDNIAQAVKNGTMTQAQADWLLQGIDKGYIGGGRGFGLDFGFGGPHRGGPRGGQPGNTTPTTPATPSTGTSG